MNRECEVCRLPATAATVVAAAERGIRDDFLGLALPGRTSAGRSMPELILCDIDGTEHSRIVHASRAMVRPKIFAHHAD